jgi:hypothetical protein
MTDDARERLAELLFDPPWFVAPDGGDWENLPRLLVKAGAGDLMAFTTDAAAAAYARELGRLFRPVRWKSIVQVMLAMTDRHDAGCTHVVFDPATTRDRFTIEEFVHGLEDVCRRDG